MQGVHPVSEDARADFFDTLVHKDPNGNLLPGLATRWKLSPDTLTLFLRKGVTFSDGEKFDAEAVKAGLEHRQSRVTRSIRAIAQTSSDTIIILGGFGGNP